MDWVAKIGYLLWEKRVLFYPLQQLDRFECFIVPFREEIGSDRQLMVHHLIMNDPICVNVLIAFVLRTEQGPPSESDSSASLCHFEGRWRTVKTRRGSINTSITDDAQR
jgi:hypothetical protein